MNIPKIGNLITGGRKIVGNAKNNYVTPDFSHQLGISAQGVSGGLKNTRIGKWFASKGEQISKALHLDKLKTFKNELVETVKGKFNNFIENGWGKKIKDFTIKKYEGFKNNELIKSGTEFVKTKWNNFMEKPKVKSFCQSVREFFGKTPKTK